MKKRKTNARILSLVLAASLILTAVTPTYAEDIISTEAATETETATEIEATTEAPILPDNTSTEAMTETLTEVFINPATETVLPDTNPATDHQNESLTLPSETEPPTENIEIGSGNNTESANEPITEPAAGEGNNYNNGQNLPSIFDISKSSLIVTMDTEHNGLLCVSYNDKQYSGICARQFTLTGTSSANKVSFTVDESIELSIIIDNLMITGNRCPVELNGSGTYQILLKGENSLQSIEPDAYALKINGQSKVVLSSENGSLYTNSAIGSTASADIHILSGLIVAESIHTDGDLIIAGGNVIANVVGAKNQEGRSIYPISISGLNAKAILNANVAIDGEPYAILTGIASEDGKYILYLPYGNITVTLNGVIYTGENTEEYSQLLPLEDSQAINSELKDEMEQKSNAPMFTDFQLHTTQPELTISEDGGTFNADIPVSFTALKDGSATTSKITLNGEIFIPEGISVPDSIYIEGNKIIGADGKPYFELTKEENAQIDVLLSGASMEDRVIKLSVIVTGTEQGMENPFDEWGLVFNTTSLAVVSSPERSTEEVVTTPETSHSLAENSLLEDTIKKDFTLLAGDELTPSTHIPSIGEFKLSFTAMVTYEEYPGIKLSASKTLPVMVESSVESADIAVAYSLPGTGSSDTSSLSFTYNGRIIKGATISSVGSGMGSLKTGERTNGVKTSYYEVKYTSRADAIAKNAYIRISNGFAYTDMNGKTGYLDMVIYFWDSTSSSATDRSAVIIKGDKWSYGGIAHVTGTMTTATAANYLRSEFHFYTPGTNSEVSASGCATFMDLDTDEGYKFPQGVTGVYTHDDNILTTDKNGYYVGVQGGESDPRSEVSITFSSTPSKPLQVYYQGHKTAGSVDGKQYTLSYVMLNKPSVIGDLPSKIIMENINTTEAASVLFPQLSAPGYTFDGWHLGSITGPKYTGTTLTKSNVTVYGQFNMQFGSLTVNKTISGVRPDLIKNNNVFSFRLYGTSLAGVAVNKTVSITGNGSAVISDIPVGTYKIEESCNGDLWQADLATKTVTISNGTTASVSFTNTARTGTVHLTKEVSDPSGTYADPKGFIFHLEGTSSLGTPVSVNGTTNENGEVSLLNLLPGTYTVTEIGTPDSPDSIPSWWDCIGTPQTVTVTAGQTANITARNIYKTGNISVKKKIENAPELKYNKDAETRYNDSLAGFAFKLTGASDSGVTVESYAVTDETGIALFKDIPIGTEDNYTIVEIPAEEVTKAAAAGNISAAKVKDAVTQSLKQYVQPVPWNVSVTYDDNNHTGTVTDTSTNNTLLKWRISVVKKDAEMLQEGKAQCEASLEGAVYGLYDGDKLVDKYTTDKNGVFTTDYYALGDEWYIQELSASNGYLIDNVKYHIKASIDDIITAKEYNDAHLSEENQENGTQDNIYEHVMKGSIRMYKLAGDTNETDKEWLSGAGFTIYHLPDVEDEYGATLTDKSDTEIVQWLFDNIRTPENQGYQKIIGLTPATVYAAEDDPDVTSGKLVKSYTYNNGVEVGVEAAEPNRYIASELKSDSSGMVITPRLPYGKYIMIETTTPKGKTAAAPRVITISQDDKDKLFYGDGNGTPNGDIALWDKDITAYVRIIKKDAVTGNSVATPGAKYVIHDLDGAYFNWYMKDKTSAEKEAYKSRFGDLIVDMAAGYYGSYNNSLSTIKQSDLNGISDGTYIRTTQQLPQGSYLIEEVCAPQNYIRQGYEGLYRTNNGETIWEIANWEDIKWGFLHKAVSSGDTGIWIPHTDIASEDARIKFTINADNVAYNTAIGAFVTDIAQPNQPAVGKIAVYVEGEYLTSVSNTGSTLLDRVDPDTFPGYTSGTESSGVEISTFQNSVFRYDVNPVPQSQFIVRAAEDIYSNEGEPNETLLFAKGHIVTTLTTNERGEAWSESIVADNGAVYYGLPLGMYTISQSVAGAGFALSDENRVPRQFSISYEGETIPITYKDTCYQNPRQSVDIGISKYDAETGQCISGAVLGLYAKENIFSRDGNIIIKKDSLIAISETTDGQDGEIKLADFKTGYTVDGSFFENGGLPLAKYYVKELLPPKGYTANSDIVEIDASYNTSQQETIRFKNTGYEDGYKFVDEQIKIRINLMDYDTEEELDGAEIRVIDGEGNEAARITTVHNETAIIKGLEPNKIYYLEEVIPRSGYSNKIEQKDGYSSKYMQTGYTINGIYFRASDLVLEHVSGNKGTFTVEDKGGIQTISIFNKPIKGSICVRKKGEVPQASVEDGSLVSLDYTVKGLPDAEYDVVTAEAVKHPDGYSTDIFPKGTVIDRIKTDHNGYSEIKGLYLAKYDITETKAPIGYSRIMDDCTHEVDLKTYYIENAFNTGNYSDSLSVDTIFENPRQIIDLGSDPLPPDPDLPGNPDADPDKDLYLKTGIYKIGLNKEKEVPVEGAEFTLYAKENILDVLGNIVIKAGTKIETSTSGENGRAVFRTDLPTGIYAVKETKHPYGYYSSNQEVIFDTTQLASNDSIQIIRMSGTVKNTITRTIIYLKDDMTGNELEGATLKITDSDGNDFTTIATKNTEGEGHLVLGLNPGETYTIEEVIPRVNYTNIIRKEDGAEMEKGNAIHLTIPDITDSISIPKDTVLEFYNAFITGSMNISKDGEMLETAKTNRGILDKIISFFDYEVKQLGGAEFTLYAATDIYHPDGITGLLYKKGDLVEKNIRTIPERAVSLTNSNGIASFDGLYVGQYIAKETNLLNGYAKNILKKPVTVMAKDFTTQNVGASEGLIEYTNLRQKVFLSVTKHDKEDKNLLLEGAKLGLYSADDISNAAGNILIAKDTLIETSITGSDGIAIFSSDLPLSNYYIMELSAPAGYTYSPERILIDASWRDDGRDFIEMNYDFSNEITKTEISKLIKGTDSLLSGSKLEIIGQQGDIVDSWVTGDSIHLVKGLKTGGEYTLRELSPAPGYTTAPDITFTVKDCREDGTYEPQQVVMEDEPTKVNITVWEDAFDGNEIVLPDVKYHIENTNGDIVSIDGQELLFTSSEVSDYFEKLPVGTYKIVIDAVPSGHVIPQPIKIDIKDTPTIQEYDIHVGTIIATIKATDKATNTLLDGVKVTVSNKNSVIYKDMPLVFVQERLGSGDYIVEVTTVPKGYVVPEDISIKILEKTSMQEFIIPIDHTKLQVEIYDKDTGKNIPDVKYTIADNSGHVIKEDATPDDILEYMQQGGYMVTISEVPDGYIIPKGTRVTVQETTGIQKFRIGLEHIKINIRAKEKDSNKTVKGITFQLIDSNGKVVCEWTSKQGWELFEYVKAGSYTIHAVSVPEGYEIPADKKISIDSISEIQKFEIELEEKPSSSVAFSKNTPAQTNDPTDIALWFGALVNAIFSLIFALRQKKKHGHQG